MQVVWRVPETPQPPQSQQPQHGGGASSSSSRCGEWQHELASSSSRSLHQQQQQLADRSRRVTRVGKQRTRQLSHTAGIASDTGRSSKPRIPDRRLPAAVRQTAPAAAVQYYRCCEENYCPPGLGEQVLEAARCCLRMLTDLHGFSPVSGVTLKLHIGIGAGRMTAYTVGGHMKKWYA